MALIWYHNPNFNWAMGMTPGACPLPQPGRGRRGKGQRGRGSPGKGRRGAAWSRSRGSRMGRAGSDRLGAEPRRAHRVLVQAWTARFAGPRRTARTAPPRPSPPAFLLGSHCDFLVIKTHISQDFCLKRDPQGGDRAELRNCEPSRMCFSALSMPTMPCFSRAPNPRC